MVRIRQLVLVFLALALAPFTQASAQDAQPVCSWGNTVPTVMSAFPNVQYENMTIAFDYDPESPCSAIAMVNVSQPEGQKGEFTVLLWQDSKGDYNVSAPFEGVNSRRFVGWGAVIQDGPPIFYFANISYGNSVTYFTKVTSNAMGDVALEEVGEFDVPTEIVTKWRVSDQCGWEGKLSLMERLAKAKKLDDYNLTISNEDPLWVNLEPGKCHVGMATFTMNATYSDGTLKSRYSISFFQYSYLGKQVVSEPFTEPSGLKHHIISQQVVEGGLNMVDLFASGLVDYIHVQTDGFIILSQERRWPDFVMTASIMDGNPMYGSERLPFRYLDVALKAPIPPGMPAMDSPEEVWAGKEMVSQMQITGWNCVDGEEPPCQLMSMNVLGIPSPESSHPDLFYMIVFAFHDINGWHMSDFTTVQGDVLTVPVYGYEQTQTGWNVQMCQNHDATTSQVNTFSLNTTTGGVDFSYVLADNCPLPSSPPGLDSPPQ